MKKFLLAALLSAALFWSHPYSHPINNSESKAAVTQTAKQPRLPAVHLATSVTQVETPAPQSPVAQEQVTQGCDSYRNTFAEYSWDVNTAIAICKAESNGNTNAISPTQDRGLMQINSIHADMVNGNLDALYDPSTNISVAARIYGGRGWSAWSTYLNGSYLRYL